jgi:hypothetical protein
MEKSLRDIHEFLQKEKTILLSFLGFLEMEFKENKLHLFHF